MKFAALACAMQAVTVVATAGETFGQSNKVIYGKDDRVEVFQSTEMQQTVAASTAAMIPSFKITQNSANGVCVIPDTTLQSEFMLCPGEPFAQQKAAANCSGFLVAPDLLVTAGHCMEKKEDCTGNKWLFDYKIDEATGKAPVEYSSDKVYGCKEIVKVEYDRFTKQDYSLIRLDRPVKGRTPLSVRTKASIAKGEGVFVIGHPSGLPTKVAGGANVRDIGNKIYWVANLDTFGGNSGSAVFNSKSGEVEGILVRGERDYTFTQNFCREAFKCKDDECRGEDVTRVTNILELVHRADLIAAAEAGDLKKVKDILALGVNPNINDNSGNTALLTAIMNGQVEIVRYLTTQNVDVGQANYAGTSPVVAAINRSDAEIISILSDYRDMYEYRDENGNSLLHIAIMNGDMNLIQTVASKVPLDLTNNEGLTAMAVAAKTWNLSVMELLISKGAKANVINAQGETLLKAAFSANRIDAMKVLLKGNAVIGEVDKDGKNFLYLATESENKEMVKYLFFAGIDINDATKQEGNTVLHATAINNNAELAKFFLVNKVDYKLKNKSGIKAITMARRLKNKEVVKAIRAHKWNVFFGRLWFNGKQP